MPGDRKIRPIRRKEKPNEEALRAISAYDLDAFIAAIRDGNGFSVQYDIDGSIFPSLTDYLKSKINEANIQVNTSAEPANVLDLIQQATTIRSYVEDSAFRSRHSEKTGWIKIDPRGQLAILTEMQKILQNKATEKVRAQHTEPQSCAAILSTSAPASTAPNAAMFAAASSGKSLHAKARSAPEHARHRI
jgi:hypothetical protein